MTQNYAEVTDDVLKTLGQQANDVRHAIPLCKPFRADLLENMVRELQCWRRNYPQFVYTPKDDMLVVAPDNGEHDFAQ